MTEIKAIQAMTIAMRTLNETVESMKQSQTMRDLENREHGVGGTACPVCQFAHAAMISEIGYLLDLKKMLVEKSNSQDKEEKIVAAATAKTAAEETLKRCGLVAAFMEVAHSCFMEIARGRIEMEILNNAPDDEEMLDRLLQNTDFPIAHLHFDPKKAN